MKTLKSLAIGFAALAAFVSFLSVAVVSHAAGPVKCEVTEMGKKIIRDVATEAECTRMGGKVVKEAEPKK